VAPRSTPLFGYDVAEYDQLYADKLELLLAINSSERVTWSGTTRPPLHDALVVPRVEGGLKIWLGTGGNPGSSVRAGLLGLPIAYGILGGTTDHWIRQADLYRQTAAHAGHDESVVDIGVASHGFVATNDADAKERFYRYESAAFATHARERGAATGGRDRASFERDSGPGGMIFAGSADEIADRLVAFHRQLGHSRHILQMDLGHIPKHELLEAIELLGTVVAPRVRDALQTT
jgi:alkanesulfonate monooxygenase SsuD/methylene tetrahydromethanopterin reductase-like flavin-dependent oxidoreductase (luciferase family)